MTLVTSGRSSWRAYLELVRLPNLFTVLADIGAAFVYAGAPRAAWSILPVLAGAAVCLYAGGVVLNDVFDLAQDRTERPQRPIPSRRVPRGRAAALGIGLLVGGLALAGLASGRAVLAAAALVVLILLYDAGGKRTLAGPALMGGCRGLSLLLGMSVAAHWVSAETLVPAVLYAGYVASITHFAARETESGGRGRLLAGAGGAAFSVAGLIAIRWLRGNVDDSYLIGVAAVLAVVAGTAAPALRTPSPDKVQRAMRAFLLMLVGFDACLAWSAGGIGAGAAILALVLPALLLSRLFRMT